MVRTDFAGATSKAASFLAALLIAVPEAAGAPAPLLEAVRLKQAPRIDGALDDNAWRQAAYIPSLMQASPAQGAPPREATQVWIGYDEQALYVAFRCEDHNPRAILASQVERDTDLNTDDIVRVVLDPAGRGRDGYLFEVNALGTRRDELVEDGVKLISEWDAIWSAAALVDDRGWSAEFAIPFKSLAFEPNVTTWGFNVERLTRRYQERDRWAGVEVAKRVWWLPDAGRLVGLSGLHRGVGLDAKVFATARRRELETSGDDTRELEPGFDVVWHVTPAIAATFTLNTDFAEVEVDAPEVNLTRFPLFFPEKRDFFLQDAPLFRFGGLDERVRPFFSRRIGLTETGEPVSLLGGAKLTGRTGPWSFALLHSAVNDTDTTAAADLSVGRVAYQTSPTVTLGAIATHGDPRNGADSTLLGIDLAFLDTQFRPEKTLELGAWAMQTDTELAGETDEAFGARISYPNEPWHWSLYAAEYGENFDPALGFIERTGIREYAPAVQRRVRFNHDWLRTVDVIGGMRLQTDLTGRTVSWNNELPRITFTSSREDELELANLVLRDVLLEPFEITGGVVIPAGDYRFRRWELAAVANPSRPLAPALRVVGGEFYSGTRHDYRLQFGWQPGPRLYSESAYELRQVRLPQGAFDVHIGSLRVNVALRPGVTWNTIAQFDSLSRRLGLNVRLRWNLPIDNDIYLVFNRGYDVNDGRLRSFVREAVIKAGWTFRF